MVLERLGRWCVRRRWWVVAGWAALVIVVVGLARVGGALHGLERLHVRVHAQ